MGNAQRHYTIQTLTQAILIPQFFPVFEKSSGHASCPKFGIMQASKFLEWGQRHPSKTFWHQRRVTVGSNTSNRVDYNRPLAKLAQAVKVADASNQRKAKCKTVSAIAVALREDTKSFDKADSVFNKDTFL